MHDKTESYSKFILRYLFEKNYLFLAPGNNYCTAALGCVYVFLHLYIINGKVMKHDLNSLIPHINNIFCPSTDMWNG